MGYNYLYFFIFLLIIIVIVSVAIYLSPNGLLSSSLNKVVSTLSPTFSTLSPVKKLNPIKQGQIIQSIQPLGITNEYSDFVTPVPPMQPAFPATPISSGDPTQYLDMSTKPVMTLEPYSVHEKRPLPMKPLSEYELTHYFETDNCDGLELGNYCFTG